MKLTLKQVYRLMTVLTILIIVFYLLGALLSGWFYLAALSLTVVMMALWGVEWRCPKCGRHLGRMKKIKYCPHCANALELLF